MSSRVIPVLALAQISILASFVPAAAEAGIRAVWAAHDGLGLARDAPDSAARARNAAWDGHAITLVAAGNETLAFQVIVEADGRGIPDLSVSLPALSGPGGATLRYIAPDRDPTITRDRPIRLFALNYMHVTEESHAEWVWVPGSPAAPRDTRGWKPVQLVPENARAGRGGFPLRVAPRERQAVFVEIYTGHGHPPGRYTGEVVVRSAEGTVRLPLALEILDFVLPDRPTLPVMVFYEGSQPELYQGRNLDAAYDRFAHAHRVELVHAWNPDSATRALPRFDGRAFTRDAGYEGPGERIGNRIVPASFYGPGPFASRAGWPQADAWVQFLQTTLPGALSFVYLPDEPTPSRFAEVRRIAEEVHANPGPGRALPTFVTRQIEPALKGAIDIWCVPPQGLDLAAAASEQ